MIRCSFGWFIVFLILPFCVKAQAQSGLDRYWQEVSRTVAEGDFEAYAASFHSDAVLVNGLAGNSYPITDALAGWKQGFSDTRSGRMRAGVEFRFSNRIHGTDTAHETGIFRYVSQTEGEVEQVFLIHFEGLLVKQEGEWLMLMEYQKSLATEEEWEALK